LQLLLCRYQCCVLTATERLNERYAGEEEILSRG
jgi:hypothetical protein